MHSIKSFSVDLLILDDSISVRFADMLYYNYPRDCVKFYKMYTEVLRHKRACYTNCLGSPEENHLLDR